MFVEEYVLDRARTAYASGQPELPLDLSRAALLIIDMQDEFVRPEWSPYWVPDATRIVPEISAVLSAARRIGMTVIHTAFASTHEYLDRPRSGSSMPNRYPDLPDEAYFREACIVPELAPADGEVVIYKPSYGAFYDTPLDTILRNRGCDTVIITGTLTNVCCGTTARQAYERGYHVVFGSNLTATNDASLHNAELQTLRYAFARVMTGDEILRVLNTISTAAGA